MVNIQAIAFSILYSFTWILHGLSSSSNICGVSELMYWEKRELYGCQPLDSNLSTASDKCVQSNVSIFCTLRLHLLRYISLWRCRLLSSFWERLPPWAKVRRLHRMTRGSWDWKTQSVYTERLQFSFGWFLAFLLVSFWYGPRFGFVLGLNES